MKQTEFTIHEKLRGYDLSFKTTFGLFSYKKIDDGTRLLINSLDIKNGDICLDLGCGYGPIGIIIAKLNPQGKVYFVDRDFVVVEYTKQNCKLNDIKNHKILLSNGFGNLKDLKFDVIASNLPSHISNEMLEWMLSDAKKHLDKNGRLYIVTVSKLKKFIKREFENIFGDYKKIARNNMYTVSFATNKK